MPDETKKLSREKFVQQTQVRHTVLFLLRTYNDIDHITPIIWKAAASGWRTYFLFVDQCHINDYRIRFAIEAGATHLQPKLVEWYHQRFRRWLLVHLLKKIADRVVAHTVGRYILKKKGIQVVANEWSGEFGREMAEYFLRPAKREGLRCISLPHGYYIWRNSEINRFEVELWATHSKRPDFTDRNAFSTYIVQNEDAKQYYLKRGVRAQRLKILGSSRFCPEWFSINYRLICPDVPDTPEMTGLRVLFFVPDWTYNVDRKACIMLIERIASLNEVCLDIKANTRGTGSLSDEELSRLRGIQNVSFPDISQHSPVLIKRADIVINFASSIGLEAILQRKQVCNPVYLNRNTTIFDGSDVVFDAHDHDEVVHFIKKVKAGSYVDVQDEMLNKFLKNYVLAGEEHGDVLQSYVDLFSEEARS